MSAKKNLISTILIIFVISMLLSLDPYNVAATNNLGKLTINNKIGGRIYLSFKGPKNYNFFVEPGKTIKEMEQGEYTYSFFADGDTVEGTVKLKRTATLALKLIRAKLTINNKIGGNIHLNLDGPRNYSLWVLPGKTIYELVPGIYDYSYYAEGGYEKGSFDLKKKGGLFVMKIDKGNLKINSKYPQNVFVTFSGPVSYYLWVLPGKSTQIMRVGNYKYEYWADGKNNKGSFTITKKGNTLVLEPPKVCNCNSNIYNCSDFNSQYEAQQCYLYCLGQRGKDIHRLDGDNDGRACETLR